MCWCAQGRVVRGEAAAARSRYEEDVHPGNHTSVWGSWWDAGQWGYACCHQTVRAAYCTGAAGGEAAAEAAERMAANLAYKAAEAAAQPPPSTTAHLEVSAWPPFNPECPVVCAKCPCGCL